MLRETVGDHLFYDVTLPEGWKITPTEHPMWSNLVNNKGKIIANVFYKAAFYDRGAHTHIMGKEKENNNILKLARSVGLNSVI